MMTPSAVLLYICTACWRELPAAEFTFFFSARRRATLREGRCKECMRAKAKKRTHENRQAIRGREADRKDKAYRTTEQWAADRERREREDAARRELHDARREMGGLLRCLLVSRVIEEHGVLPSSLEYRARYRSDEDFRRREIARTQWRKRARRRLEHDGELSEREVEMLRRSSRSCAYCHTALTSRNRTLDHLIPLSRGGEHTRANVAPCCRSCNSRKWNRTPLEWMLGLMPQEPR